MNESIIQKWFKKNIGGSLLLPDGWFGRPYDNIHLLTSIDETSNCLRMTLDDGYVVLAFYGEYVVEADRKELTVSGFSSAVFRWFPYGVAKQDIPHSATYTSGEIVCVSRGGNMVEG